MPNSIQSYLSNKSQRVNLTKDLSTGVLACFAFLLLAFISAPVTAYILSLSNLGLFTAALFAGTGILIIYLVYTSTALAYIQNYMIIINPMKGLPIVASVNCIYHVKSSKLGFIWFTRIKYSVDGKKSSKLLFGRSSTLEKLSTNIEECITISQSEK